MAVIGIDLGTTNSVVATVRDGQVLVLPDSAGNRLHPTVIGLLPDGTKVFSHAAVARRVTDPMYTVHSAKRFMGLPFRAEEVRMAAGRVAFSVREGTNEQPIVMGPDRPYTIPELMGLFLAYLKGVAEHALQEQVTGAVVTVPANFDDAQRRATMDAGRIAGLPIMRVLNEPTAAALAYGIGRDMSQRIAIYDFGGGTFDVTLLQVEGEIFEVLATGGDSFLGGDDIDNAVMNLLAEQHFARTKQDLLQSPPLKSRLVLAAEQIKRHLSVASEARGELTLGHDGRGAPVSLAFAITRAAFDQAIATLVARSIRTCDEVLSRAGLSRTHIDEVIMVGGTTRIPMVRTEVERAFGRRPHTDIDPDQVVAWGAAIQAASLQGGGAALGRRPVLLDVTPRALGIAVAGGFAETIIDRNVAVPVEQQRVFTTSADNQTRVTIAVCQGESRKFDENTPLGELELSDLPPGRRGEVRIEVTFRVDSNGILRVKARDPGSGREAEAAVNVRATMTEEEIAAARAERVGAGNTPPPITV